MNSRVRDSRAGLSLLHRRGHSVRLSLAALLAPAMNSGLAAQSGAATPLRPAPSDSVHRLAVDPARFAGMPYVTLLDEAHVRVEPDGRAVHRTRAVRSQLTLDVPESDVPRIVERNLASRRRKETTGGRRLYTWATANLSPFRPERFASDSNGVVMSVAITTPGTWSDIARWYHGRSCDRYALSASDAARLFWTSVALPPPGHGHAALARELVAAPRRVFPVDAATIVPLGVSLTKVSITPPPGWTVELPRNVLATSLFGRYESSWTMQGREIRLVRRIGGGRGIFPPERIAEVIVWLKAVGADDYEFLSLRPAPVP